MWYRALRRLENDPWIEMHVAKYEILSYAGSAWHSPRLDSSLYHLKILNINIILLQGTKSMAQFFKENEGMEPVP